MLGTRRREIPHMRLPHCGMVCSHCFGVPTGARYPMPSRIMAPRSLARSRSLANKLKHEKALVVKGQHRIHERIEHRSHVFNVHPLDALKALERDDDAELRRAAQAALDKRTAGVMDS